MTEARPDKTFKGTVPVKIEALFPGNSKKKEEEETLLTSKIRSGTEGWKSNTVQISCDDFVNVF